MKSAHASSTAGLKGSRAKIAIDAEALRLVFRQAAVWFRQIPADESLYSSLARFHSVSGYHRSETTSMALLGHAGGSGMLDTPAGMDWIAQATGGAIPATESTLRQRSVLAPYLSLMASDRRMATLEDCRRSDPGRASIGAGLVFNRVAPRHPLRLCMTCCEEQRRDHGFAYWRASDQWPGRWLCRQHKLPLWFLPTRKGRPGCWRPAEWSVQSSLLRKADVQDADLQRTIERIGAVVDWFAGRDKSDPALLQIVARERLTSAGFLRHEASCSRTEYLAVHAKLNAPLAGTGISDFVGFGDGSWVRQVLVDRRYAHPLRWAVLLSAHGPVSVAELDAAYQSAGARHPQPSLFETDRTHRRSCAPKNVYDALTGPVTLDQAALQAGVRKSAMQAWLRRDADLAAHRKRTTAQVRLRAAVFAIKGYCRENPEALRIHVIRHCLWAVRCLEQQDRTLLEQLLPAVVPMFDRQLRLIFES